MNIQVKSTNMKQRVIFLILMAFPIWAAGQKIVLKDSLNYYKFVAEAYFDMV